MDFTNVISSKEKIGGLELSDNKFRFCLLRKKASKLSIFALSETDFKLKKDGDDFSFTDDLRQFSRKNNISYVILTIPSHYSFNKTYSFPLMMADEKISESIKLTAEMQLPDKAEKIYWDSMKYDNENQNQVKSVLVSSAKKEIIDKMISSIERVGIKVVAIETKAMSLARSIKQNKDKTTLIIERGKNFTSFYTIKNNAIFLVHSISNKILKGRLSEEIKVIELNSDWFGNKIDNISLVGEKFEDSEIKKIKLSNLELTEEITNNKAINQINLPVIGAAIRASISRKEDDINSLMNIGTEDAYKQAKVNSTINFLISITLAVSIFFILAFYSSWILISTTQNNFNEEIISFNNEINNTPYAIEKRAAAFNQIITQVEPLIKGIPNWSIVVKELQLKAGNSVIIKNMSLPGVNDTLSLSGKADSRDSINDFRFSLESSELLSDVSIPLDNLGKKQDIPFTATFKLKSPEIIYQKD